MVRTLCRAVVGLVIAYALAVAIFAIFHYDGDRPDVLGVVTDFHSSVGGLFSGGKPPTPAPVPVEKPEPPVEAPKLTGPPTPPVPADPDAPTVLATETVERHALDKVEADLGRAEELAKSLRDLQRGKPFDDRRGEVMALLDGSRDVLNTMLDRSSSHARANTLWKRMQDLSAAVRKL